MMNPDDRDHLLLAAYLDGELSPGEILEMERRLADDPDLRRLRDGLSGLSGSISDVIAATPVPDGLAERIRGQFTKVEILPARRARPSWHAIAAALVVGLFAGSLLGYGLFRLSAPANKSLTVEAIVAGHLRGLAAPEPFDVASSDRHTVKPWFNGRTAIAPDVPDLAARGYPLVGGRVDIVGGKSVPTLVYGRRQHVISVTVVPKMEDDSKGTERREGSLIVRWNAGDLTYFVTSDLNPKELGEFGALFRAATSPLG